MHFHPKNRTWGDFSLFCLDSMWSTISAKSSLLCGDKVSLSDRPWMSSYIMQCVSWLWTVFSPSSESWSGGELEIASCRYGQLEIAILHGDLEQIANWVDAPRAQEGLGLGLCAIFLVISAIFHAYIHVNRPQTESWSPLGVPTQHTSSVRFDFDDRLCCVPNISSVLR
jgi:hypothetical protein